MGLFVKSRTINNRLTKGGVIGPICLLKMVVTNFFRKSDDAHLLLHTRTIALCSDVSEI